MVYMVTFTIHIPHMLVYIPYMDLMGMFMMLNGDSTGIFFNRDIGLGISWKTWDATDATNNDILNGVPPDDLPETCLKLKFWPPDFFSGIFWKLELVESFWVDQCQVYEIGSRSPGWQSGQSQWHLDFMDFIWRIQTQIANPLKQTYTYTYWLVNQFPSVPVWHSRWNPDVSIFFEGFPGGTSHQAVYTDTLR